MAVAISLILVPVRHRLVPCVGQSSTRWPQTMPWLIRRTKLRAPASVFSPRVRRTQGLKRAQKPPLCHQLPERQQDGTVQPQVQPWCTLWSQNHSHRAVGSTDGQPSLVHPGHRGRATCGSGTRLGSTASTSRHNVAMPTPQPSKARIRGRLRTRTLCMYRLAVHSWKDGRRWREVTPGGRG